MRRVVYVTSRIPLGILEVMVQSSDTPLVGYFAYPLDVPDELLESVDRSMLSPNWRTSLAGRSECRILGEGWRLRGASAGLIVPSAVVSEAYEFGDVNVVLNPLHEDFTRVKIERPIPLQTDSRLQPIVSSLPSVARKRRAAVSPARRKRR